MLPVSGYDLLKTINFIVLEDNDDRNRKRMSSILKNKGRIVQLGEMQSLFETVIAFLILASRSYGSEFYVGPNPVDSLGQRPRVAVIPRFISSMTQVV